MIRRLLLWLAEHLLQRARVIMDREGKAPYLSRWYLLGAPRMPDGSWPFDEHGSPREGIIWHDGWGLYLHRFHKSDSDRDPHNHPFRWSLSLVLSGGYLEERVKWHPWARETVSRFRLVRPLRLNFIRANDFHKVHLVEEDAWTLFLVGPKSQGWGFMGREGQYWSWRDYYLLRTGRNPGFARHNPGE